MAMTTMLERALLELEKTLGSANKDGVFNYIYPVTTENIAGYTRYVNNFSTVLSVAGSGDHLLNCIYHGAKEVTLFDINPITFYLVKLKMAMLTKPRQEFRDFFITSDVDWNKESPLFFAERTYLSVRGLLNVDEQQFWDTYYKWLKDHNLTPQESELFRHIKFSSRVLCEVNEYLASDAAYQCTAARAHLVEVNFINCGLAELPHMLQDGAKFNTILLSNLSDYARGAFGITDGSEALDAYSAFVEDISKTHLSLGGQIFFAYIYEATTGPGWTEIDKIDKLPQHFKNYQMKTFSAISGENLGDYSLVDCVLIKENI